MKKQSNLTLTVKLMILSLLGTLLIIFLFSLALAGPPRPPKIEFPNLFQKPVSQKKEELIPATATATAQTKMIIFPPAPMSSEGGINNK